MSLRRRATALLGLTVAVAGVQSFALPGAQAISTGLVISEVYGGGGNTGATLTNDFVELYNPTPTAISVAGMSVQYRATAGTSVGTNVTALTGSVPAGGHFLVQEAAGTGGTAALPTPDSTGTIAMAAGSGQVLLVSSTTPSTVGTGNLAGNAALVDMVGYGTASSFEGAAQGTALTSTTSASRAANGADTDDNASDFVIGTPTPTNAGGGPVTPGAVAVTPPGDRTASVGVAITPFTLAATGGTPPYTWAATGLPAGLTLSTSGTVSGTPTATGTSTVDVTVADSAAPPAAASASFTYTVSDPGVALTIAQIQGSTDTSPVVNQLVTTTGVVTATYPVGGLAGFTIQTGGAPSTPDASDGVFVYAGTNLTASQYPVIGSTVTVAGTAVEFFGLTEINVSGPSSITAAAAPQPSVTPQSVVPGTDCVQGSCPTAAALDAEREKHESETYLPTGSYTVTDAYDGSPFPSTSSANFGEIGLAARSTDQLIAPTELYDSQTQADLVAARTAYNDAHRVILDDGSSTNYTTAVNTALPLPWFTLDHTVRDGAAVTFPQPVVLSFGNSSWKIEPSGGQVVGAPTGKVAFAQNRPAAPSAVGGDVRLATFNVLNYFPTTAADFVALAPGNTCSTYKDRAGNPVTANTCAPDGPRGAADAANLQRQQAKIVSAVNRLGASIVSLEEIENSVKFGKDRDYGVSTLVAALNSAAGQGTWAFAPSPPAADLPPTSAQDVIRTAFIYKPADVALVGPSQVLVGSAAFTNARQPLAQGFKKVGAPDDKAFAVVVNHFKSKGSGVDDGTGQGNANPDRIAQAQALATFASSFTTQLAGSGATFLTGDFNAYSQEDPIQVLTGAGYANLESTTQPGEKSYNFSGQAGSLDHVFANPAARALVTGVDIWNINADESIYYEYSRFNYNVTDLYDVSPFRASDHNPEIVGLNLAPAPAVVDTTTHAKVKPSQVVVRKTRARVRIKVTSATGVAVDGQVTLKLKGHRSRTVTVRNGKVTIKLGRFARVGRQKGTVTFVGNAFFASSTDRFNVYVRRR